MRAFIAIPLPDDTLRQLAALASRLQKAIAFTGSTLSWVPVENIHLTLKFLGADVAESPDRLAALRGAMERAVAAGAALHADFKGIGCFPHERQPSVLWVGLRERDVPPRTELARRLDTALAPLGFPPETRPFKPHLTLGRFRRCKNTRSLTEIFRAHQEFARFGATLDRLVLYESDLSGPHPVYRERASVALPAAATAPAPTPPPSN